MGSPRFGRGGLRLPSTSWQIKPYNTLTGATRTVLGTNVYSGESVEAFYSRYVPGSKVVLISNVKYYTLYSLGKEIYSQFLQGDKIPCNLLGEA